MVVIGRVVKGKYFDSVALMRVAREVAAMKGVIDAALVMATKENRAILSSSDLMVSSFNEAGDADLLIGVKAESKEVAEHALNVAGEQLETRMQTDAGEEYQPKSVEGALRVVPDANVALVSVAGRYAGAEAMVALTHGLHVMIFSDNVPLQQEIELKRLAKGQGRLVMGPDCGTAIINGVPLGFANAVARGPIGVVAASGTGLQEVSSIITNEGLGISQAIGTGGRDVTEEVGGIMFLEAFRALVEDDDTRVILLVSKPPAARVVRQISDLSASSDKSVVSVFLGAEAAAPGEAATLEDAALTAVCLAKGEDSSTVRTRLDSRDAELKQLAKREAAQKRDGQKHVRGLFSGGTFCAEAQIVFNNIVSDVYSNAPVGSTRGLEDPLQSHMNTVVDLGADEFTVGRLHPMIDFSLRVQRLVKEAQDPETAVILLDVVLGYGANPDPASELTDVIRAACGSISVVCSVTGTESDPQNKRRVAESLQGAGAIVLPTNAAACRLAAYIIQALGER